MIVPDTFGWLRRFRLQRRIGRCRSRRVMTAKLIDGVRRRTRRGASLVVVAAAVAATVAMPVAPTAGASSFRCPKAEPLVARADWHRHRLASGVRLAEGRARDAAGVVSMHVLTVRVTRPGLSFGPLVRHVAQRTPLSRLAAGRRHLVAAVNTGFYDFATGVPSAPVVNHGRILTASRTSQHVVGFGTTGLVQHGFVSLTGAVTTDSGSFPVAGLNVRRPGPGVTVYTPQWGARAVPVPWTGVSRYVRDGKVSSAVGAYTSAPKQGRLLVAVGPLAQAWLRGLHVGEAVNVTVRLRSSTKRPFRQAYGVGLQTVRIAGVPLTGLACRLSDPTPARTAIGYADGGRTLLLVTVEDRPGTRLHGLDQEQMSRVMVDLGAARAFAWDGSGSTELLARMPGSTSLRLRTHPADGAERPMPVGFGVFFRNP